MSRSNVSSVEIEIRSTCVSSPRSSIPRARSRSSDPTLPGSRRRSASSSSAARSPIVAIPRRAQPLLRARPDAGQEPDVERGEERRLLPGRHDCQPARLAPVGRDLGDDLAGRDAERAGQRGRAANGGLDGLGELAGGEEVRRDLAEVEVALVDPGLLDRGDDLAHRRPDRLRVLAVQVVARPDEDRLRAAPERLGAAHRRVDPERPRDVVRGRDDPAAVRVAPDDERLAPQRRILELLDRGEERVQVEVRDDHSDLTLKARSRRAVTVRAWRPSTFRLPCSATGRSAPPSTGSCATRRPTSSARPATGCASSARSSATRRRSAAGRRGHDRLRRDPRRPRDRGRRRGDGWARAGRRPCARAAPRRQARRHREQAARRRARGGAVRRGGRRAASSSASRRPSAPRSR